MREQSCHRDGTHDRVNVCVKCGGPLTEQDKAERRCPHCGTTW